MLGVPLHLVTENMRSRRLALGFGVLLALAWPGTAAAQPAAAASGYPPACLASSVPSAKSDEAHAFYMAGRALYDERKFAAALTQFRESYSRDCSKHDLLVIISRSHERNGDRAEAVRALEVFLDRVKDSPDAAAHRTKIDDLKKAIAAQPPPPSAAPPTAAPPTEVREHTIAPWIVVGVGGAAIITGVILLIAAPKLPDGCAENPSDGIGKCPPDKSLSTAELATNLPRAGIITMLAGTAVVGGGLLWHFLEPTGPVTASGVIKPRLTPAVAPGYAGMSLGGTF